MVGCESNGFARIGNYLSLISGLICALLGMLLLRWVASLFYLGLLIVLASLLQRMTYKTFGFFYMENVPRELAWSFDFRLAFNKSIMEGWVKSPP